MGEFSLSHILLLTIVLLLFFGPSKLPALGQSLGKAIRGFKSGLNEIDHPPVEAKTEQLHSNQAASKETAQTRQKTEV